MALSEGEAPGLQLFPPKLMAIGVWRIGQSYTLTDMKGTRTNFVHIPHVPMITRKPRVTLYGGPDKSDSALATMDYNNTKRSSLTITTNVTPAGPLPNWRLDECGNVLWSSSHRVTGTMVPGGPQETFEWRYSKGGGAELSGSSGWELTRLTNDMNKVVAVSKISVWSINRGFTFAFVNEGLDGLGPEFEVMAVATAVWIEWSFSKFQASG